MHAALDVAMAACAASRRAATAVAAAALPCCMADSVCWQPIAPYQSIGPHSGCWMPQVCDDKLWAAVGREFNPPKSMTNLRQGLAYAASSSEAPALGMALKCMQPAAHQPAQPAWSLAGQCLPVAHGAWHLRVRQPCWL